MSIRLRRIRIWDVTGAVVFSATNALGEALRGEIEVAERIVGPHATASYARAHGASDERQDAGSIAP